MRLDHATWLAVCADLCTQAGIKPDAVLVTESESRLIPSVVFALIENRIRTEKTLRGSWT